MYCYMYTKGSVVLKTIFSIISVISAVWSVILVALIFCSLVIIHELGHYIAAKVCGLYVPRFSIGLGPILWK
ncbi:MAG: site-2 protease family protein, partial [Puniceicoccales bacterium]|nr:site-2 protease family protein [Puniceicoccales bacterium]